MWDKLSLKTNHRGTLGPSKIRFVIKQFTVVCCLFSLKSCSTSSTYKSIAYIIRNSNCISNKMCIKYGYGKEGGNNDASLGRTSAI